MRKLRWTSSLKAYTVWTGLLLLFVLTTHFNRTKNSAEIAVMADTVYTTWLDSMHKQEQLKVLQPFNPNYFTDFRAYVLQLPDSAYNRLKKYRATNQFVHSLDEFKKVTGVTPEWLNTREHWLKFPDWISNTKIANRQSEHSPAVHIGNLNKVSAAELEKLRGIGPVLAQRIVAYRERLGGYVDYVQLEEVYGLSDQVRQTIKGSTTLLANEVRKIKINEVDLKELIKHPYFDYSCAKELLIQRSMNGKMLKVENLEGICAFSANKLKLIGLYLDF